MPKLQKYNNKNGINLTKTSRNKQKKLEILEEINTDGANNLNSKIEIDLVAKKRFGQNFLVNIGVKNKIKQTLINFLSEFEIDNLLEIGPGKGDITEFLLDFNKNFRAIEIDPEAITFLQNKFDLDFDLDDLELNLQNYSTNSTQNTDKNQEKDNKKTQSEKFLIQNDKQTKDLENSENPENIHNSNKKSNEKSKNWLQFGDALQLVSQKNLPFEKFALFSSLPYNVASRILVEMAINYPNCPFCVIVQKEVAMKLIDDKLTFFGAFLRLFYDFDKVFDVHGGSFDPKPKVMSSLLIGRPKLGQDFNLQNLKLVKKKITNKTLLQNKKINSENDKIQNLNSILIKAENRQIICQIIKKLVANPRKTLANNLANLDWEKEKIEKFITKYNYYKTRLLYSNYQEILVQILKM